MVKQITLVWAFKENERIQDSQKVLYMNFKNNKAERQTEKYLVRLSEGGWKTGWWNRLDGKGI